MPDFIPGHPPLKNNNNLEKGAATTRKTLRFYTNTSSSLNSVT